MPIVQADANHGQSTEYLQSTLQKCPCQFFELQECWSCHWQSLSNWICKYWWAILNRWVLHSNQIPWCHNPWQGWANCQFGHWYHCQRVCFWLLAIPDLFSWLRQKCLMDCLHILLHLLQYNYDSEKKMQLLPEYFQVYQESLTL